MEFEVRLVGGIESCFVSLPLSLIRTLESTTASGHLPPILAVELRSRFDDHLWHVAWSGAASVAPSPSSIQIAQQYAECIGLLDHTTVQVRVVSSLPKATLVTIEPLTEDDWEILELNSELAEQVILKQVGILHKAMRFPLWLHGQTIVTFVVVSTSPDTPVVQLVPNSEVAVAPKRRSRVFGSSSDSSVTNLGDGSIKKVLLRVQGPDSRFVRKYKIDGIEIGAVLTSSVFIHPETANKSALNTLEYVVIVPRSQSKNSNKKREADGPRMKNNAAPQEANSGILNGKGDCTNVILRVLLSESVAKGHIMLSESLRLYLRLGLHSWVYVRQSRIHLKKELPLFSLSPCEFKMFSKSGPSEDNGLDIMDSHKNHGTKYLPSRSSSVVKIGMADWTIHETVFEARSLKSKSSADEDIKLKIRKGMSAILRSWCLAQIEAIASYTGVEVSSLVLANKMLLHVKVKEDSLARNGNQQLLDCSSLGMRNQAAEQFIEVLYVLSMSGPSLHNEIVDAYEVIFDERRRENPSSRSLEVFLEKLQLSDGVSIDIPNEIYPEDNSPSPAISSLSWMGTAVSDVLNRLAVLLSPTSGMLFSTYKLPIPGHILVYGPPGSGKSLLAAVAAKSVGQQVDILAYVVSACCSRLALEKPSTIRQALLDFISEALEHAPSIIIFDDLDSIVTSSSDSEVSQPSSQSVMLTELLTDIMDEYEEKRRNKCGFGAVAFIATAQSLTSIPQTLTSSGRFDFHVSLPAPAAAERCALLKHEIQKRSLQCPDDMLLEIASKCDGYDAYDLEILVDRTVHAAIGRALSSHLSSGDDKNLVLFKEDFVHAMHEFLPVAMRDIAKPANEDGRAGWDDVGGLNDIQNAIKEMIELPSRFPNIFSRSPLRMRSNILLYGPPGCGKTHIVGAAAAACSLRFISVKGPELLNKYIGASEQAVRDIFSKAAAAAPCLLFFDEFDSIAPKRGHDNTGVTDRVVNQFLTELDGVEVLTGVFVFAATSRPDLLDAALLRPGRLDRLLFCDFPSQRERLDILSVLSRKLPMASDVDLNAIARMTEGFSGADLQALLSDAQLEAVHELLSSENHTEPGKKPVITNALLRSVASKAKPSVSETEKQRLYDIYSQFLDSKRSVAAQTRDAKGKRATLA